MKEIKAKSLERVFNQVIDQDKFQRYLKEMFIHSRLQDKDAQYLSNQIGIQQPDNLNI
jgi:hypothetical protein